MINHTTKMFKAEGYETVDTYIKRCKVTVRYSISKDGTASVSFSDDKSVMLHILVDDNIKKMARELLK